MGEPGPSGNCDESLLYSSIAAIGTKEMGVRLGSNSLHDHRVSNTVVETIWGFAGLERVRRTRESPGGSDAAVWQLPFLLSPIISLRWSLYCNAGLLFERMQFVPFNRGVLGVLFTFSISS